jgi:uncharacterized protein
MKLLAATALTLSALMAPIAAQAETAPVVDCPLADAPFSTALPVIDLLRNPAAKAVIDRQMPGVTKVFPPAMFGTQAPSFAAIVTLKELAGMGGAKPETLAASLAAIDTELAHIPVTAADRQARCERYDDSRPVLDTPPGHPRLLLFEKINGFKDVPGFNAAHAAFLALAKEHGWSITVTDRGGAFTPAILRRFDAVIWNNISGDVLTLPERRAFRQWMEHGGAYIGVHGSAGDPVYWWDWYTDDLIGARFKAHPFPHQFQDATIIVDDPASPVAAGLPAQWTWKDEWYSFKSDPRAGGAHVIARLDESTYDPDFRGTSVAMGADHPIAWTRCIGPNPASQGRMFYSAIGHRPESYADPHYLTMLANAVTWATDKTGHDCRHR